MYKFSHINCSINNKHILQDIHITLPKNKISILLGPSGCGKSTLMTSIAGRSFYFDYSKLKLNNKKVNKDMLNKKISFVYQHHKLPAFLTVYEYLEFICDCKLILSKKEKNQIINLALKELGIQHIRNRRIGQDASNLSGGEIKRVEIACEFISSPQIIFLDEPLSGLDSLNSYKTISFLKGLNKTMLISMHTPSNFILEFVDNIIILFEGKKFFEGSLDDLKKFVNEIGYEVRNENVVEFLFIHVFGDMKNFNDMKLNVEEIDNFDLSKTNKFDDLEENDLGDVKKDLEISAIRLFFKQLNCLFKRHFKEFYRDYKYGLMRGLIAISCSFIIFMIFRHFFRSLKNNKEISNPLEFSNIDFKTNFFLFFMVFLNIYIQSAIDGCNILSKNFHLIIKENTNKIYTVFAYYSSIILFEYAATVFYGMFFIFLGSLLLPGDIFSHIQRFSLLLGVFYVSLISLNSMLLFSAFFVDHKIPVVAFTIFSIFVIGTSGFISSGEPSALISYGEKINPIRYGMCISLNVVLKYFDNIQYLGKNKLFLDIYEKFTSVTNLILISSGVILFYFLFCFVLYYWKFVTSRR